MSEQLAREPIQVHIRAARQGDLDALLTLETGAFAQDRLNRRRFRYLLLHANACTLVAENEGCVRGYVCVLFSRAHLHARIYSIAVDAHARGRGAGTALLAAAEAESNARRCRDMRLEVHDRNAKAIALYRRCGYRMFAEVDDYYPEHGRALRFEKPLPHAPLRAASGWSHGP